MGQVTTLRWELGGQSHLVHHLGGGNLSEDVGLGICVCAAGFTSNVGILDTQSLPSTPGRNRDIPVVNYSHDTT